jgi:LPS sulfotransferase NodH
LLPRLVGKNSKNKTIFLHLPKTGGTTFREILLQAYPNRYHYCEDPDVAYIKGKLLEFDCVEFHVGEFQGSHIYFHKELIQKQHWPYLRKRNIFIMFRDPVERVISNHFELSRKRFRERGITPGSLVDSLPDHVHNKQVGYVLGNHPSTQKIPTKADLEAAKDILESLNIQIGILERYGESLQLFEKVTKKRIANRIIPKKNQTGKFASEGIDEKIRNYIRERNFLDQELYEYALRLFETQIRKAKLNPKDHFTFKSSEDVTKARYFWENPQHNPAVAEANQKESTTMLKEILGEDLCPTKSYLIFSTPRSGSTYLCDNLQNTRRAGRPREHFLFWYLAENEPDLLTATDLTKWRLPLNTCFQNVIEAGSQDKIFASKVMYGYLEFVLKKLRLLSGSSKSDADLLYEIFPNLRIIYLEREDRIRQAVSLAKARQSGRWHFRFDPKTGMDRPLSQSAQLHVNKANKNSLVYDFKSIRSCYEEITTQSDALEEFLSSLKGPIYKLTYENLEASTFPSIEKCLDYLGIEHPTPLSFARPGIRKMSDEVNEEWSKRFEEDLRLQTDL